MTKIRTNEYWPIQIQRCSTYEKSNTVNVVASLQDDPTILTCDVHTLPQWARVGLCDL
jgi:hypothetical protein